MRFDDTLSGLLLLLVGVAVVALAQSFPPMPGQHIGAALFPTVAGGGLALFAALLVVQALRARSGAPWVVIEDWMRRPRMLLNGALVIGGLVFYALAVQPLGYFLTSIVFLALLLAAFGVARKWVLPLAVTVTFAIHFAFYTLLRVPLPWGVFEAFAW